MRRLVGAASSKDRDRRIYQYKHGHRENQPHKSHLTSKINSMTVPVIPTIDGRIRFGAAVWAPDISAPHIWAPGLLAPELFILD